MREELQFLQYREFLSFIHLLCGQSCLLLAEKVEQNVWKRSSTGFFIKGHAPIKVHVFLIRSHFWQTPKNNNTYLDILQSATFSLRIKSFSRPHITDTNRICSSLRIRIRSSIQGPVSRKSRKLSGPKSYSRNCQALILESQCFDIFSR